MQGGCIQYCNSRYKTLREILMVFQNGSNWNYHIVINQLVEEFKEQLECLGENTEKILFKNYLKYYKYYLKILFTVPIEKRGIGKTIVNKIRFINSVRFMTSFL